MPNSSPTVRKRQLAMELRRMRRAAGKEQDEAAEWLGITAPNISRLEKARQLPSIPQVRSLCQLYGVDASHAAYLVQLRGESAQRGWYVEYGKTVPSWFADYLGFETECAEKWTWEPELIPGLAQTPDYTRAISKVFNPDRSADELDRIVRLRAERQRRLTDDPPLTLRVIMNEAVLRRQVGGPQVMTAQLKHLIDIVRLPNVTLQVHPFSAGAHRGMVGPFALLRFPDELMNTVYLEGYGSALYAEDAPTVALFAESFESLARQALDSEDAVRLIGTMIGSE